MSRSDDDVTRDDVRGDDALELDVMTAPEFDDVRAALGFAAAPIVPSASLKDMLMARIAVTPQLAPASSGIPVEPGPAAAHEHGAGQAERRAQSRWFSRPGIIVTAAAAALALFFAGVVSAQVLLPRWPSAADELALIVAAPDVSTLVSAVSTGGTATLVASESVGRAVLVVDGLEPLSDDERYALWYISDGVATPAGLFAVTASGASVQVLEGAFEAGTVVGVTVEPAGGSPAPTSDPIVVIATA